MPRPRGLTLVAQAEFSAIADALSACGGNKLHAAKRLGISRSSLYRKMGAFGIQNLAADLVHRVGGHPDDNERVEPDYGVGAALGRRPGDV
jgi:hypothetical protein